MIVNERVMSFGLGLFDSIRVYISMLDMSRIYCVIRVRLCIRHRQFDLTSHRVMVVYQRTTIDLILF